MSDTKSTPMQKFVADVLSIGEWVTGCKTENQIRNLVSLYETVISRQFHPGVDNDSILDSICHLDQMVELQLKEINKHYESHFSKL